MLDNHEDSNAELYRRTLLSQANEIEILKNNVFELQKQLQAAYKKLGESHNSGYDIQS